VPDGPGRTQGAIELMRAEGFPAVKNSGQLIFADGGDYCVHVIRHYCKLAQLIAHPVKMHETGLHDGFALRLRQDAPTATRIKPAIYRLGEALTVFASLAVSVRLWTQT
jgi:hypothetical protein